MALGCDTADNSRRLFEAFCRALEAPIFETAVQPVSTRNKQLERLHIPLRVQFQACERTSPPFLCSMTNT